MGIVAVQEKQFCFLTTWMENKGEFYCHGRFHTEELYILMDYERVGERVAWFYFLTATFLLLAYYTMLLVLILHHFLIFFWKIPDDGFLWELRVGWVSSWDKISFQDENAFVHIFHSSSDYFILGRKLFFIHWIFEYLFTFLFFWLYYSTNSQNFRTRESMYCSDFCTKNYILTQLQAFILSILLNLVCLHRYKH